MRILKYMCLFVLVVLPLLSGGGYIWLKSGLPDTQETYQFHGLSQDVTVTRDEYGIPFIKAQNLKDASFALGFLHAQDRLWQMDMMRRFASGRLSEVLGEKSLESDKFMRMLGFSDLIAKDYLDMSQELKEHLEAYAGGVNAYLDHHKGSLSPEFYVLGYRPERWNPSDTLFWQKAMALQLSHNWRNDLLRGRMLSMMSEEELNKFWPNTPDNGVITLTKQELEASQIVDKLLASIPDAFAPQIASNAWVISGALTESGKPILANDPHLKLLNPGHWYLTRIDTPETSLAGVTAPCAPFIILGHNSKLAWGFTTTMGDVQDVFIEKLDPQNPNQYIAPDGPKPFLFRDEEIKIKGQDSFHLNVRITRHGPIISDVLGKDHLTHLDGDLVALSWSGLEPGDRTPQAMFEMNKAQNAEMFQEALRHFHAPQQNIHFADIQGNIGFYAPTKLPIRNKGTGLLPMPGWNREYDWKGFVPFEELPHSFNPKSGILYNANNKVVDESYPHHVAYEYDIPGARASRLKTLFETPKKYSIEQNKEIQLDVVSDLAKEFVPILIEAKPDTKEAMEALTLFKFWEGKMDKKAPQPLLFEAWLKQLHEETFKKPLGDLYDEYLWWRPESIKQVLVGGKAKCTELFEEPREKCLKTVSSAYNKAFEMLKDRFGSDFRKWQWGKAHKAAFKHQLFTHIPLLNKVTDKYVSMPGHKYTVNEAASVMLPMDSFIQDHGPGLRAIYDLSDLNKSQFMITPGQSGHILSPFYMSFLKKWSKGEYLELGREPESKEMTLVLKPELGIRLN